MQVAAAFFVGREGELARLRALVAEAREGRSRALALSGAPGQGKTALLDRLCHESSDVRVLRATGVETEAELPFGTLDALLRPLLGRLDALPGAQRQALEGALALGDPKRVEPFAVGAGTLSLLAAAAEQGPLLCVVDDFHWVDAASRRALLFAARRLERESIAAVFGLRPEGSAAAELRGIEQVEVPPLPDDACERILRQLTSDRLPAETAALLTAAAAGNPLTLLELADRLTPEQREGREGLVGPPPPSARAEELLAERVAALPTAAGRAVVVASACDDANLAFVRRALERAGLSLDDLLAAEKRELVHLRSGQLEWRHPLVRSVAYHGSTAEHRRAAHAAIAAELARGDGRRPWHLAAAATEPDEEVAVALEQEADGLRLRGGYAASAQARARAADMTPDPTRRVARLLDANSDFEFAGDLDEARRMLERARELTEDTLALARIRGLEASLVLRQGRPLESREILVPQARLLAGHAPTAAARFHLQAAFASMSLGEVGPWEHHAREALELVRDGDRSTRHVATAMLASALVADLRLEAAEPLLDATETSLLERAEDDPIGGAVEVYALMARSLLWIERWDPAERILGRLEQDARRLSIVGGLPYVLNVRSVLDMRLGRWSRADAAATEAASLARDVGDEIFFYAGSALRAWVAALYGREGECRSAVEDALGSPQFAGLPRAVANYSLGLLALGRGEIEDAVEQLAAVEDGMGCPEPGSRPWEADLIEAHVRAGDVALAEERLARWEADGARTRRPLVLATAARCRGLLCLDEQVEQTFERALAHHAETSVPFERARTLLCLGERRRRAKRRADAREPLREALAVFDRLGAADWARRARRELRATGGMVPAPAPPALQELTPHEVQVALLVAEGKTNREVAAALFLAPKTIEHHLSTIFRKLDIKRRTELARLFAGELAARPSA